MSTILVIDDEPQILNMLQKMLELEGYTVLTAADGKQGLRACEKNPIDLVITDVVMPEVEGLEVIMSLKKSYPTIKIIAISGGARIQPGDYLNMAEIFGAQRTFTKPFERQAMLDAVKELLDQKDDRSEN